MTDRPILFSAPMVRAILAGTKTQTRRVVNVPPAAKPACQLYGPHEVIWDVPDCPGRITRVPYRVGGHLWVRETWAGADDMAGMGSDTEPPQCVAYRADETAVIFPSGELIPKPADTYAWNWTKLNWRPGIYMPRWASRITLEVTGLRVERLQDISEADAYAEGVGTPSAVALMRSVHGGSTQSADARVWFRSLWDSLNAKRAPWSSNPWVWVVEFKRITAAGSES